MQQVIGSQEYKKIGETLCDRTAENSAIWNIIQEKENDKKIYGTGWNYIEKGSNLENYGKAKYNWLINYETEEIIKLEDESYSHLNGSSTVAIKDGLMFYYDAANANTDVESFGENTTLYYYDNDTYGTIEKRKEGYEKEKGHYANEEGAFYDRIKAIDAKDFIDNDEHAFKFNGNNYIEIKQDSGFDFSNGITFDFFGQIDGNVSALADPVTEIYRSKF